jgi:NAD(P)-dependent dehydrogenase (short-subunit alcohol dehydrogenase family)
MARFDPPGPAYGTGMSRVLITGSADGLGQLAARLLVDAGHQVVLHARNPRRGSQALAGVPGADGVLLGDLSSIEETRGLAEQANASGRFDAIIHNAGVGYREYDRVLTKDGLAHVFAVNVLAPYLLTALIDPPARLIYLSSGMHRSGDPDLSDLQWERRAWNGTQAYADSKLFVAALGFAVARQWPHVLANTVEPGWVSTRTGGARAPDDLAQGHLTQAWLATSDHPDATVTGGYFYHQRRREPHPAARDRAVQDGLLAACAELTGTPLPAPPAEPAEAGRHAAGGPGGAAAPDQRVVEYQR